MTGGKIVVLIGALVLLLTACGGADSPPRAGSPATPRRSDGGGSKEQAPAFSVETFSGDRFSLAEQKGTPVVLNFWESW